MSIGKKGILVASVVVAFVAVACADPAWWSSKNVTDSDTVSDYAPLLLGQLKWMATNAFDELDGDIPFGAGSSLSNLVGNFSQTNNYHPANVGQLRYVGDLFYDRLIEEEYCTNYPWSGDTNAPADSAVANVGQLKFVFDFDVSTDADADSLPDWWEIHYFGDTNQAASGDYDSDNVANSNEFANGIDPSDPDTDDDGYNDDVELDAGVDPDDASSYPNADIIGTVTYSGIQTGLVYSIAVTVSNSWSTNNSVVIGSPGVYTNIYVGLYTNYWIKSWRDSNGNESNDYWEATGSYTSNPVYLTNHVTNINITLTNPTNDVDADSMPDWWEYHYFGNTNQPGSADYDSDGLNNSNEYVYSTVPTNTDTDADGYGDGMEVDLGTDPTDAAWHPSDISGAVAYSSIQTGQIYVVAVTVSNSWSTNYSDVISSPSSYSITDLPNPTNYSAKAYRDSNGNQSNDYWEATGDYASNPIYLTDHVTGINITLSNPTNDVDADGIPDWWEMHWFGNTNEAAAGDNDSDDLNNLSEYQYDTCPTNSDSDTDGFGDGFEVATGTDPADAAILRGRLIGLCA